MLNSSSINKRLYYFQNFATSYERELDKTLLLYFWYQNSPFKPRSMLNPPKICISLRSAGQQELPNFRGLYITKSDRCVVSRSFLSIFRRTSIRDYLLQKSNSSARCLHEFRCFHERRNFFVFATQLERNHFFSRFPLASASFFDKREKKKPEKLSETTKSIWNS